MSSKIPVASIFTARCHVIRKFQFTSEKIECKSKNVIARRETVTPSIHKPFILKHRVLNTNPTTSEDTTLKSKK
uniref:Uncharacterized protein n=1 Tax=Physcomitrium patens TaxID=3218 RepID=A0A2K1IAF3_PHYPA|nr:hypothetical protein PHYPA_030830 [Physcomitrium patens]